MLARLMYPRMKYAIASLAVLTLFLGLTATAAADTIPGPSDLQPVLWLDAGLNVTADEAGLVSLWGDRSGSGFVAAQPTPAHQPLQETFLGVPVLRFDGEVQNEQGDHSGNDFMDVAELEPGHGPLDIGRVPDQGFTAFVVLKNNDRGAVYQRYLIGKGWLNDYNLNHTAASTYAPEGGTQAYTGNYLVGTPIGPEPGSFHINAFDLQNMGDVDPADGDTDGGVTRIFLDGEQTSEEDWPGDWKFSENDGPLAIGRHPYSGLPTGFNMWGDLGEIIIFDTRLSDADRGEVDAYLAAKYPIPVSPPGDTDGDYDVDAADAAIVAANWLQTIEGGYSVGDFDGDGVVNDIDATIMATNWTGSGASASVPEPQSLLLVALGAVCLGIMRRRNS